MENVPLLLIIIVTTLFLSGFFSGSEIAFVAANRLKIEVKRKQKHPGSIVASNFVKNPQDFLSTTLVGNNLTNIIYSTSMTFFLTSYFSIESIWVQTIISTFIILVIGEIIPKSLFKDLADLLVYWVAIPLRGAYYVMFPLIWLSRGLSMLMIKLAGLEANNITRFFEKQDVDLILQEGLSSGSIDRNESEMIENVFELKDLWVRESMIPRTEIVAIDKRFSITDCMKTFSDSGYSKLPVYQESIDNIIGIVHASDLFKKPSGVEEIIRPVMFVPEFKKTGDLLREFKIAHSSVAIVIDEFGGTAGLVTMEDIIEELVGDIQDEYDIDEYILKQVNDNTFVMSGRVELEELEDKHQLYFEEGDYETIGGYVIHQTGRIPKSGEQLEIGPYSFTVIKASKNKIDFLKMSVLSDSPSSGDLE